MAKKLEVVLKEIEELISLGQLAEARRPILTLTAMKRFPRSKLAHLARLARLAYLDAEVVRLLRPKIRPNGGGPPRATADEIAEYGLCLAAIGAGNEAIELLSPLDTSVPKIFSGLVLAHFRQWNWEGAIPLIEKFAKQQGSGAYDPASGINADPEFDLGIALMFGRDQIEASLAVLEKVLLRAEESKDEIMVYECLAMLAKNRFYARDWKGALRFVARLERARAQGENVSLGMRVELFAAASQLMGAPESLEARAELGRVRRKLVEGRYWNRVREIDFDEFVCRGDRSTLWRLYFGTPFPGAKHRYLRMAGLGPVDVPSHFDWDVRTGEGMVPLSGKPSSRAPFFNLLTGENKFNPAARFKEGQLIQRTLQAIVTDFYAPATMIALFERIYPDEYFSPASSMLKVRQALFRLRTWFEKNGIPLSIEEGAGVYRLTASQTVVLRIPAFLADTERKDEDLRVQSLVQQARERYDDGWFSGPQFAEVTGLSIRSAQRYLKFAMEQRRLVAQGGGGGRRYRILPG